MGGKRYDGLSHVVFEVCIHFAFGHSRMQPQYFNTCIAPCPKVYQQGVLHVRFLHVVVACVFHRLLPGVCLHASCHTLYIFYAMLFFFVVFYLFIYLFSELFYYCHYYLLLRVF